MLEGTKRASEKVNTLQEFTLMFWQNQMLIGNVKIPLGQCTTEVLNLSDEALLGMNDSRNALVGTMQILFNPGIKKDLAAVTEIQNTTLSVFTAFLLIPIF